MEQYIKRENLKAELAFLKELFFENLPLGDNADKIQEYFSYLEKAIATKDPDEFKREEFPPDDPATCGDRIYKYHSASYFKQRASEQPTIANGLGLGSTQSKQAELPSTEDPASEAKDLAYIQECKSGRGASIDGRNPCPDIQGQLDGRDTS